MVARQRSFRALVIGCGSIGRRHINNLVEFDNIASVSVCSNVEDCLDALNNSNGKIEILRSLNHPKADFAVICNETYKHLDTAIFLAKKGIHLFIEKPLSHNLYNIDRLKKVIAAKNIKLSVGYNLRFLGAVKYIKKQIERSSIGDLYFARIEAGQYLPQWRKNIDYKDSYSASSDKGGGVSLDLSHEIDYMCYLFGDPSRWKAIKNKISDLKIDSDDIFDALYLFKNNFVCSVHLDYLQRNKKREIRIVGSKGVIFCDFVKGKIFIKKKGAKESHVSNKNYFNIDTTYSDELKRFIDSIERDSEPVVGLEDGVRVLKLIEEIRHV